MAHWIKALTTLVWWPALNSCILHKGGRGSHLHKAVLWLTHPHHGMYVLNKDGAVASPGVSAPDQPGCSECSRAAAGLDLGLNLGFLTQTWAYSTRAQCPMFLSSVIFKNCLKVHKAYVTRTANTGGASVAPAWLTCPVLYTPSITKVPGIILQPWF